ncbi:hypothetical protein PFISCL1PPCAC_17444, partial [Pristionchus fissidentatus]
MNTCECSLFLTEESLRLGCDSATEALLHLVELAETRGVRVVDGRELVRDLIAEDETLVAGGGVRDALCLAALGVVSTLGGAEVHLGKGGERTLIGADEHLLQQILVVDCKVAARLASGAQITAGAAALEMEVGVKDLLQSDVAGRDGGGPEAESVDLSKVSVNSLVALELQHASSLVLASTASTASSSTSRRRATEDGRNSDKSDQKKGT